MTGAIVNHLSAVDLAGTARRTVDDAITDAVKAANQAQHGPALGWDALDRLMAAGNEPVRATASISGKTPGQIEVPAKSRNGRSPYLIGVQVRSFKPSGFEAAGQIVLCTPKGSA